MASRERDLERDLLELSADDAPVEPSPDLRSRLLASVGEERPFEGYVERLRTFLDLDGEVVRSLLSKVSAVRDAPWFDAGEGVRAFNFDGGPRVAEAHCGLVHMAPGAHFPMHRHVGDEWAFVLSGRGQEDGGRIWYPGELLRSPPDSRHSLTCLGDEPFVFIAAAFQGIERE